MHPIQKGRNGRKWLEMTCPWNVNVITCSFLLVFQLNLVTLQGTCHSVACNVQLKWVWMVALFVMTLSFLTYHGFCFLGFTQPFSKCSIDFVLFRRWNWHKLIQGCGVENHGDSLLHLYVLFWFFFFGFFLQYSVLRMRTLPAVQHNQCFPIVEKNTITDGNRCVSPSLFRMYI